MGPGSGTDARGLRAGRRHESRSRAVTFVVGGDDGGAMAARASAFAARLSDTWRTAVVCRQGSRWQSRRMFAEALAAERPSVTYVMDMGVDAVSAGVWHRVRAATRLVVDTGDAITALARSSGLRGPVGLLATGALEQLALRSADHVIVRGSHHKDLLARAGLAVTFVPDGVDLRQFQPANGSVVRRRFGLEDALVVGLVGSSVWSPRLGLAYGWDLVELLGLVTDLPIRGLVVGDGSGIGRLAARARELGVSDRLILAGRQPLAELPLWLAACDVCLSTQTNDVAGQVRTTGKLPLYLAAGRFVLASRVGEAARILPDEMLVPYEGTVDREYPARLADRVRQLHERRDRLAAGAQGMALARRHFDYDMLARRLDGVLRGLERAETSVVKELGERV